MRVIHLTIVLLAVICLCGCDTKNVGFWDIPFNTYHMFQINIPGNMYGGEDATWRAQFVGSPPFTVEWDFGGGAIPNEVTQQVTEHDTFARSANFQMLTYSSNVTVSMVNPSLTNEANYEGWITLTDTNGEVTSKPFSYTVGRGDDSLPVIDSATFAGLVLTVMASDMDGDAMTITVIPPPGASVDAETKDYEKGGITFTFIADSFVAGASGDVSVTANDGTSDSSSVTAALSIAPFAPAPDTLYALQVEDRIVIITGATANPFQFLNGIGLTVEDNLSYEHGTFNIGAPGDDAIDIDGAWTAMNPAGGFLIMSDEFVFYSDKWRASSHQL